MESAFFHPNTLLSRPISTSNLPLRRTVLVTHAANAQGASTVSTVASGTVSLSSLIAIVARKTGKMFVLDPRIEAQVTLIGEDSSRVTYGQLLTILDT